MQTLNGMWSEFVDAVSGQGARDQQGDMGQKKRSTLICATEV